MAARNLFRSVGSYLRTPSVRFASNNVNNTFRASAGLSFRSGLKTSTGLLSLKRIKIMEPTASVSNSVSNAYYSTESLSGVNSDLSLHVLTEDDTEDVLELMMGNFFKREPLSIAVQTNTKELVQDVEPTIRECISHGVSYGLRDTATNKLVGFKINCIMTKGYKTFPYDGNPISKSAKEYMWAFKKLPPLTQLFEDPRVEKIFYGRLINVDPFYKGRSLSKILIQASEKAAFEVGCQACFSEVVNPKQLRNMMESGFKILHSVNFQDAVQSGGKSVVGKERFQDLPPLVGLLKVISTEPLKFRSSL